jgi:hypothetical protein
MSLVVVPDCSNDDDPVHRADPSGCHQQRCEDPAVMPAKARAGSVAEARGAPPIPRATAAFGTVIAVPPRVCACPLPSSPTVFFPQQTADPVDNSAHVEYTPLDRRVMVALPMAAPSGTSPRAAGVSPAASPQCEVEPYPSCPYDECPQQRTAVPLVTHVWYEPHVRPVAGQPTDTSGGGISVALSHRELVDPAPNWPYSASPQHFTAPLARR